VQDNGPIAQGEAFYKRSPKKSAGSVAVASTRITPKICQGQWQAMYSECPKFHPNQFTSGAVIAKRVNTVQARYEVFSILGEANFSQSNNIYITILAT